MVFILDKVFLFWYLIRTILWHGELKLACYRWRHWGLDKWRVLHLCTSEGHLEVDSGTQESLHFPRESLFCWWHYAFGWAWGMYSTCISITNGPEPTSPLACRWHAVWFHLKLWLPCGPLIAWRVACNLFTQLRDLKEARVSTIGSCQEMFGRCPWNLRRCSADFSEQRETQPYPTERKQQPG